MPHGHASPVAPGHRNRPTFGTRQGSRPPAQPGGLAGCACSPRGCGPSAGAPPGCVSLAHLTAGLGVTGHGASGAPEGLPRWWEQAARWQGGRLSGPRGARGQRDAGRVRLGASCGARTGPPGRPRPGAGCEPVWTAAVTSHRGWHARRAGTGPRLVRQP
jgi:hypothetical protein